MHYCERYLDLRDKVGKDTMMFQDKQTDKQTFSFTAIYTDSTGVTILASIKKWPC